MTTFETTKVGDNVWDFILGWGKIETIDKSETYPIGVRFNNRDVHRSFTLSGKAYIHTNRTLFWGKIKFEIPTQPLPRFEIDTPLIVWDDPERKYKRYFSHYGENSEIYCFNDGATSWSASDTTAWNYVERL